MFEKKKRHIIEQYYVKCDSFLKLIYENILNFPLSNLLSEE